VHGDIWELNGGELPTYGTVEEPYIKIERWEQAPVNWWTLVLIIFGIWLVVRNA
jgi:hypothetical protein